MKEIDFNRASLLLDVVAKVTNIGPMNQPILGEAQAELKEIVADCESNRNERADKIRAEEQVAAQKALQAAESEPKPRIEPTVLESPAPTLVERKL